MARPLPPRHRAALTAFLAFTLLPVSGLDAQVRIGRLAGSVGGSAHSVWRTTPAGPLNDSRLRQWGQVSADGTLFGPRYLSFNVGLAPFVGQARANVSPPGADLSEDGLNGTARLSLFPAFTMGAALFTRRSSEYLPDYYGGFRSSDTNEWGVEGYDRNPYLPVKVTFVDRTEARSLLSRAADAVIPWERRFRRFTYEAHNWKTLLRLFQIRGEEFVLGEWGAFGRRQATASNRQTWGKGSTLSNSFGYSEQLSRGEHSGWSFKSRTHLQQTQTISTDVDLSTGRARSADVPSFSREERVAVNYRPGDDRAARVLFTHTASGWGDTRVGLTSVGSQLQAGRSLGPELELRASVAGTYSRLVRTQGQELFVHVVDEVHSLGAEARFRLLNPYVNPSSLVLEHVEAGTLFIEGLDYQVVEEGPYLTVVALPGGRLEEGLRVVASYRYQVPPEVSTDVLTVRGSLSLAWRDFELFYRRDARNQFQELAGIGGPAVEDLDQQMVGLQVEGRVGPVRFSGTGQTERMTSTDFGVRRHSLIATAGAGDRRALAMVLSARWSRQEVESVSSGTSRAVGIADVELRASRPLTRAVVVGGHMALHDWRQDAVTDGFLRFGTDASFRSGGGEAFLRIDRVSWYGGVVRAQTQISIELKRGF